jgi:RNA polymerase sigma-70 factor (ECF subfamily)
LVAVRIDRRVKQRLDESDVIQEIYMRLGQGAPTASQSPATDADLTTPTGIDEEIPTGQGHLTAYLWLRRVAIWTLADMQRKHLDVQQRDPRRECSLSRLTRSSSVDLAAILMSNETEPLDAMIREERSKALEELLDQLEPIDREIIMLRHGEQLSRSEASQLLGISIAAAAKRYLRALTRIKNLMKGWET